MSYKCECNEVFSTRRAFREHQGRCRVVQSGTARRSARLVQQAAPAPAAPLVAPDALQEGFELDASEEEEEEDPRA